MISKWKFLILGVVLGGLYGVIVWDERQVERDEQANINKNKALSLKPAEITSIRYRSNNTATEEIHLNRVKGKWEITAPISYAADEEEVSSFIDTITDYKFTKIISQENLKLADYGLQNPEITVQVFSGKDDLSVHRSETLNIGDDTQIGYSTYFNMGEPAKVYVGSAHIRTALNKDLTSFRDKSVFDWEIDAITGITLSRSTLDSSLDDIAITVKDGEYTLISGKQFKWDELMLRDYVSELQESQAEYFIDDLNTEKAKAILNSKMAHLEIQTSENKKLRYTLFAESDDAIWIKATSEGGLKRLTPSIQQLIVKGTDEFADKGVVDLDFEKLSDFEIEGQGTYKREGTEWQYVPENDREKSTPSPTAASLIDTLQFTQSESIFLPQQSPHDKVNLTASPDLMLVLYSTEPNKGKTTLKLWKDTKDSAVYYIQSSQRQEIMEISDAIANLVRQLKHEKITDIAKSGKNPKNTKN